MDIKHSPLHQSPFKFNIIARSCKVIATLVRFCWKQRTARSTSSDFILFYTLIKSSNSRGGRLESHDLTLDLGLTWPMLQKDSKWLWTCPLWLETFSWLVINDFSWLVLTLAIFTSSNTSSTDHGQQDSVCTSSTLCLIGKLCFYKVPLP